MLYGSDFKNRRNLICPSSDLAGKERKRGKERNKPSPLYQQDKKKDWPD